MLTRLKVSGFKNLIDADIYFGPFTCVAGPNGAGKSNLFDAISFISQLADKSIVDAARSIRGGEDLRALFADQMAGTIQIRAEMLLSPNGEDDFGQQAEASATFVYYELHLSLDTTSDALGGARIRVEREELNYIPKREAKRCLPFRYDVPPLSVAGPFRVRG